MNGSGSASGSSFDEFDRGFRGESGEGEGTGSIKMEFDFDQMGIPGEEEEDSPYPEVTCLAPSVPLEILICMRRFALRCRTLMIRKCQR